MFADFTLEMLELPEATLRVRHGGRGTSVLLLHGHPRTHMTWYQVAPLLSQHYYVVCPDLRGFGLSSKPLDSPDHSGSSKRAKARDCVALMQQLGFGEFAIIGHDRGSYTAFRTAMDFPRHVRALAILDGVPIVEALERCDAGFAAAWWHWFFYAQPDKPEQAILADPDRWYQGSPDRMGLENYADFLRAIHDPGTVHGMLEDYRAGLGIDRAHDEADRAEGRRVECDTLVLWSRRDDLEKIYGDVLQVWQPWTTGLAGHGIDCGHHMAEEAPLELADALLGFLKRVL